MRKSSLLRLFIAVLLLGSVWMAYTQQQRPPSVLKTNKIANDLYEIENIGTVASNVTVLITDEGLVAVDDKFDPDHDGIMAQIKTFSDKPIKYIINTHHHGDHTGGNAKMQAMGTQIISSEEAHANMVEGKMPGVPTLTYRSHMHVRIGGKNAELFHFGRSHTNGDSVILFPAQRVLATGDMFTFGDATPQLIDYAGGGSGKDWTSTIDEVLKLDFDTVVPGHGAIAKRQDLVNFRNTTMKLRTTMHDMIAAKKSREEITKTLETEFHWGPLQMARALDGALVEFR